MTGIGCITSEAAIVLHYLLSDRKVKTAIKYVGTMFVVKAARRHKVAARRIHEELMVTIGKPNFAEMKFIKKCKKAGEQFPVKKVQLKFWPRKKSVG